MFRPNRAGFRPSHFFAMLDWIDELVLLHKSNVSFTSKTLEGDNPLHIACKADSLSAVALLLKIDPKLLLDTNRYGKSPIEVSTGEVKKLFDRKCL